MTKAAPKAAVQVRARVEMDSPNAPSGAERRTEARYATNDAAELEILPGPSPAVYGTVLDVSRSGLRLQLPVSIARATHLKVKMRNTVIFGEVRYCRRASVGYHAGILIQDVIQPDGHDASHIAEDHLSLYAVGKGLTVPEVIRVREHLLRCEACREMLDAADAKLNPSRRHKLL